MKKDIKNVTLFSICWGEEYLDALLKAVLASIKNINFDKIVIATNVNSNKYEQLLHDNKIDIFPINIDLNNNLLDDSNRSNFSSIFLHSIKEACNTDYVLTIQQDSSIICPDLWTDEFLNYDYIGAPWPIEIIQSSDMVAGKIQNIKNIVGNGGFSLRSKKYIDLSVKMPIYHKNEDLNLCVFNYDNMIDNNIRFAPPDLAMKFSVEHPILNINLFDRNFLMTYRSFGFHGNFNVAGMNYINQNS